MDKEIPDSLFFPFNINNEILYIILVIINLNCVKENCWFVLKKEKSNDVHRSFFPVLCNKIGIELNSDVSSSIDF